MNIVKNTKNKNCVDDDKNNPLYLYYVNGALLFTRIFGEYRVGGRRIRYSSKTMLLGETYTFNLPPGASDLSVNIESSAYFAWTNCYRENFPVIPQPGLCFYTLGLLGLAVCFQDNCGDTIIQSLIDKYLAENPMEHTDINNNNKNINQCCSTNNGKAINKNFNNINCKNKCNLPVSEVRRKYMKQVTNYVKIMKDYLPDDVLCNLNNNSIGI